MSLDDRKVLATGIIGTVVAAICCFTPLLVVVLGAAGLAAWLGWIDYVLLPALAVFLGITAYGLYLRRCRVKSAAAGATGTSNPGHSA